MRYSFKEIARNWSYRGYTTDLDLDSFIASNTWAGDKYLLVLIGGLFRLIDENGKTNQVSLDRLIEILGRIEKRMDDAQSGQQKDAIADGILLTLLAPVTPANLVSLDDIGLSDVRSRKAIRESGCKTPVELAAFGAHRLLSTRNVGVTTVEIIRNFLFTQYGLTLAE